MIEGADLAEDLFEERNRNQRQEEEQHGEDWPKIGGRGALGNCACADFDRSAGLVDLTLSLGELGAQVRCETELSVDLALNEASLIVEVAGFQPELWGIFRFGDDELFLNLDPLCFSPIEVDAQVGNLDL